MAGARPGPYRDGSREGWVRLALAGAVLLCLMLWRALQGAPLAYLAAATAMALGLALILRPKLFARRRLARAAVDALVLGALLTATGGAESPFLPLYFLAAFSVAGLVGPGRGQARILPAVCYAAALIGGCLLAVVSVGGWATLVSPPFVLNSTAILLLCAAALYLGLRTRETEERAGKAEARAALEQDRREGADRLTAALVPTLGVLDVGSALGVIAEAARAVTGGTYSHVAALGGGTHHTIMEEGSDSCPSWWHPTVQRLLLWSCREGDVARAEETVHGVEGFLAAPVGPPDGEAWGAVIVGGSAAGAEEERALRGLAAAALPALARRPDAAGGLDPTSGLPNAASLVSVLRAELSAGRLPGVLAVDASRAGGTGAGGDPSSRLGRRLEDAGQRVFDYDEDTLVVLVEDRDKAAARKAGVLGRMLGAEAGAADDVSAKPAVGFARAESRDETAEALVGAALRALQEPRTGGRIAGVPARRGRSREIPARDAPPIRSLVRAMAARDPYLSAHSAGVSRVAGRIGRVLSLSEAEIRALEVGALLHDVGKIGTPDRILLKPGALDDEEYAVIKLHPVVGAKILTPFAELEPALPAVRHHHERFDGLGYPDKLRGGEIPLLARVVCVADAFDSMTRDRPYGRRVTVEDALGEIRRKAGTQFDPRIAGALLRIEPDQDDSLAGFAG